LALYPIRSIRSLLFKCPVGSRAITAMNIFPYVCIGKPCVFRPRATWWAGLRAHIIMTTFTRFAQNGSIGSLLALYGSTMHSSCSMWFFRYAGYVDALPN
jgi:hypothetical protein